MKQKKKKTLNREAARRYRAKNKKPRKGLPGETAEETAERLKIIPGESAQFRAERLNLEAVQRYQEKNPRPIKGEGRGYVGEESFEERKIRLKSIEGESFENRQIRLNDLAGERYREAHPDKVKEAQTAYFNSEHGKQKENIIMRIIMIIYTKTKKTGEIKIQRKKQNINKNANKRKIIIDYSDEEIDVSKKKRKKK